MLSKCFLAFYGRRGATSEQNSQGKSSRRSYFNRNVENIPGFFLSASIYWLLSQSANDITMIFGGFVLLAGALMRGFQVRDFIFSVNR